MRTKFEKVTSEDPSRVGFIKHNDNKTQPAKTGFGDNYSGNINGDRHDFNIKGKVTNNAGSDYHDLARPSSGLNGNYADKDASLEYLRNRNKDGIEARHYSGTTRQSKLTIGNGMTAYDGKPIPEVYKSATSQGTVPPNAIEYNTKVKSRNTSSNYDQPTESDNLIPRMAKHLKTK